MVQSMSAFLCRRCATRGAWLRPRFAVVGRPLGYVWASPGSGSRNRDAVTTVAEFRGRHGNLRLIPVENKGDVWSWVGTGRKPGGHLGPTIVQSGALLRLGRR